MKCTDCSPRLHDYVDGELIAAEAREIDAHLASCAECRIEVEKLRQLRHAARMLPRELAPARDLWARLQDTIARADSAEAGHERLNGFKIIRANEGKTPRHFAALHWLAPVAMAASIALLATFVEQRFVPHSAAGWAVAALSGVPQVGKRDVRDDTRMRVGQWLVTDEASRAKLRVGNIGEVSVEPNSRLRLVGVRADDHRLELARGTLSAMIWAPPRLFFVNTPSATAVDLGCAYTLKVDDEGNGELEVTTGFVALEDRGRESILRTGMMCLTRRGVGPGTPFAVNAPASLRAALARFDFERGPAKAALADILAASRTEDGITLWHLLDRTEGDDRAAVFDRLATYSPPPADVTRAGILANDKAMLKSWGSHLGIDRF